MLTMKAVIYHEFGDPSVLKVEDVDSVEPYENEVRVKVSFCAVNTSDARIRGLNFPDGFGFLVRPIFGFRSPRKKILGGSFSGTIDKVGSKVTDLKVGDQVCVMNGMAMGGYAQYVVPNKKKPVVKVPDGVSEKDAAAVLFGGTTALYFLKDKANLTSGQKILINGASGAVGTNAVQIAKIFGAEVTAVTSTKNIDLMKQLGADKVIDYTVDSPYEGEKYDVILDCVGTLDIEKSKPLLSDTGKMYLVVASLKNQIFPGAKVSSGTSPEKTEHIEQLLQWLKEEKLQVVIEQVFALDQADQAHVLIDSGRKVGNVLLRIEE